jgi:phosphate/sulfate permease
MLVILGSCSVVKFFLDPVGSINWGVLKWSSIVWVGCDPAGGINWGVLQWSIIAWLLCHPLQENGCDLPGKQLFVLY